MQTERFPKEQCRPSAILKDTRHKTHKNYICIEETKFIDSNKEEFISIPWSLFVWWYCGKELQWNCHTLYQWIQGEVLMKKYGTA